MNNKVTEPKRAEGIVLAAFGEAELVNLDGRLQLRGGTMADRIEALEWVSIFLPDEAARVKREL